MREPLPYGGEAAFQQCGSIESNGTLPLLHTPSEFILLILPDHRPRSPFKTKAFGTSGKCSKEEHRT